MIENTVAKLYEFIAKMLVLLDKDLANIPEQDNELQLKKNITSIFNRLVALVIQLNKLSKEERFFVTEALPEEDLEIIDRFVSKYKKK